MNRVRLASVVLGFGVWLAVGCTDDDDGPGTSASGGKGAGGHAGVSGKGVAGRSGSAGLGTPAGAGGAAGVAGSATGAGGSSAGRAGSAGGGSGGIAGICPNETPPHKLNDTCPLVRSPSGPPYPDQDTLTSTCSKADDAAACAGFECGEPWSPFDENICFRPACYGNSDCAADQRCAVPAFFGKGGCVPSGYGDMNLDDCLECISSVTGDCSRHGFCLSQTEYPPANDCDTTGKSCSELEQWLQQFELYPGSDQAMDLQDAIAACRTKLEHALAKCSGTGGSAGAAGAGGQAG